MTAGGFVADGGGLHVDVLKVQHHGSEHNWHHDFGRRITADHYVFCGNGDDHNPDLTVVGAVLDSRFGSAAKRSSNPETGNRFDLWFNCASSIAKPAHQAHMKKIERKVRDAETAHPGLVVGHFLEAEPLRPRDLTFAAAPRGRCYLAPITSGGRSMIQPGKLCGFELTSKTPASSSAPSTSPSA